MLVLVNVGSILKNCFMILLPSIVCSDCPNNVGKNFFAPRLAIFLLPYIPKGFNIALAILVPGFLSCFANFLTGNKDFLKSLALALIPLGIRDLAI